MRKRDEVKVGESCTWWVKVLPSLPYKAGLDAKVLSISDGQATIAVASDVTAFASKVEYQVTLSELESKTWVRDEEAERSRFEKATVVDAATCDALIEPDGEKIYYSVDEYLEWCEDNEVTSSNYLWCVNFVPPEKKSADCFKEDLCEQFGDEYSPEINGLTELQQAIDAFYTANSDLKLCETDYSKVVMVPALVGGEA